MGELREYGVRYQQKTVKRIVFAMSESIQATGKLSVMHGLDEIYFQHIRDWLRLSYVAHGYEET